MTTCVSSSLGWLKRRPPAAFTRRRSFSSFFPGRPHRYSYKTFNNTRETTSANWSFTILIKRLPRTSLLFMNRDNILLTLQPSSISSAGQTVRSRLSMGSGASRRLMVPLVTAVSFIVILALTEMWLKPNRDGPSGVRKKNESSLKYITDYHLTLFTP